MGLQPNVDKSMHLQIRRSAGILDPWGSPVKATSKMKHFGGIISASGVAAFVFFMQEVIDHADYLAHESVVRLPCPVASD